MDIIIHLLYYIFLFIQISIAFFLLIPLIAILLYAFISIFRIKAPQEKKTYLTDKNFEFGLIITAHQETEFIIPLVDSILKQTYKNFYIYIVADDCDTNMLNFDQTNIKILSPSPPFHAKVKSIQHALSHFERKHDAVIIFDSDNLIHPSFLEVMNDYFRKGYKVVQADFKPKNTDTQYARMDAIGDMFNFFLDREMRMRLGLSSAIWGSGVAVDYDLYTGVKYKDYLGGFDKRLQDHLVQNVKTIAFAPEAILFDEKISSGKSLQNQRTRWINTYFKYFNDSFRIFLNGLGKLNFNLIYFSLILLRPPLFIVLAGAIIACIINYFTNQTFFYAWVLILLSFLVSFAIIVVLKGKDIRFLRTMFSLPLFVFRQTMAFLRIKKARKAFLKTRHTKIVFIDELLKENKTNSPMAKK
ncbi:MAG: glycosyltransferase family 2 protein [Chitinophagaceae bacterium]|nr:glycosyltransferase family 2 protein [Chitinophagaceae bacterium]MCW5928526.1 glycosyltransferase family 2 protein [Chitinophagaceae bacterium]